MKPAFEFITSRSRPPKQVAKVHVLAGGLETAWASGLGDVRGRLANTCSETSCLAVRGPTLRRVSETRSATEVWGLAEYWEGGPLSQLFLLEAETLTGSERNQLR